MINLATAILHTYPYLSSLYDFRVEEIDGEQKIIMWSANVPQPTDEELQQWWIGYLKKSKLQQLSDACQKTIYGGFKGFNGHLYQFEEKDQGNISQQLTLLLLDVTISSVLWKTMDAGIQPHTREDFIKLANDANNHKRANMGKYWQLEARVGTCTTESEINSIVW